MDKEVAGTTTYDYGFRIYSPGLGRFLSVDPLTKTYPWYTPYQFAGNKPTIAIDLDGLEEKIMVNSSVSVVKPSIQNKNALSIFDEQKAHNAGVNFIMSNLKIKEIQQKSIVGPPLLMNAEFRSAYLTLEESEEIIKETINEFTIQSSTRYSENKSSDLSMVTETYNVNFDFNYSLLGDENTIKDVKEMVSKASTIVEYAADISGSDLLNKISAKGGIASSIINSDTKALCEAAVTSIAEKGLKKLINNKYSFFAGMAPKAAEGAALNILSLSLTNSGPKSNDDQRDEKIEDLRIRTQAALLFYFETGNTIKTGPPASSIPPTFIDNTGLKIPIPLPLN